MTDTSELHARLLGIKLRALVAEHLGRALDADTSSFPNGAALVIDGAAWVLIEGDASRALGGALAWALRHDATSLDVVAEADTGLLARRADAAPISRRSVVRPGSDVVAGSVGTPRRTGLADA